MQPTLRGYPACSEGLMRYGQTGNLGAPRGNPAGSLLPPVPTARCADQALDSVRRGRRPGSGTPFGPPFAQRPLEAARNAAQSAGGSAAPSPVQAPPRSDHAPPRGRRDHAPPPPPPHGPAPGPQGPAGSAGRAARGPTRRPPAA